MAIVANIHITCPVCMGRYLPLRNYMVLSSSFEVRDTWSESYTHKYLLINVSNATPLFYNTLTDQYVEGLPADIPAAAEVLRALLNLHRKLFLEKYGALPFPVMNPIVEQDKASRFDPLYDIVFRVPAVVRDPELFRRSVESSVELLQRLYSILKHVPKP